MKQERWIIKDLLNITSEYLRSKQIKSPRLNAEVLLAHQLKTNRIRLYLDFDQPLGEKDINSYRSLIKRLLSMEPVQYITGKQEFWSLDFTVDSNVLIPRPETEILVEQAMLFYSEYCTKDGSPLILDLGTGSGAIAVSIASEQLNLRVLASDISPGALEIARKNAVRHGVHERIQFVQGDLFTPFSQRATVFDMIISNPPYVTSQEYHLLSPEVRDYEPRTALDGHEDGMFYINRIIKYAHTFLRSGGRLIMEMDPRQMKTAIDNVKSEPAYECSKTVKDYNSKERVLIARKI